MWRVLRYGGVPTLLVASALGSACADDHPLSPAPPSGGGGGVGGSVAVGGTGAQPSYGPCAGVIPATPLTRLSIPDIDGTLDALFGPGPTLASAVTIEEQGYQRDLSSAFVAALRRVASQRVATAIVDSTTFEICADDAEEGPACLQRWLRERGERLYRRPLTTEQVAAYVAQFQSAQATHTAAEAARNVLVSMVLSPYFVFRIELGEGPDGQQLSAHEIATRLSHFATRQAPDAELLAAAAGGFRSPTQLVAQLERLSETPEGRRARTLRILEWLEVSETTLPETLDPDLRRDMLAQSRAFVDDVFERDGGSLNSLLTSPHQPFNARLAQHYGEPALTGEDLVFVDIEPSLSAGVLSEGLFLSSYPRPTLRGRAIVERLMCRRVAEHPVQVDQRLSQQGTPRQRIEQSTGTNPVCSGCHRMIDPIGFALDGFDDQGRPTGFDSTSDLPSDVLGTTLTVSVPRELGAVIASSNTARACAAQRYVEAVIDRPLVETITAKVVLPPGNAGAPFDPTPLNPDQQWVECLVQNASPSDFNLLTAAKVLVSGSLLQRRLGAPQHFAALDTSRDPVEHAYQETAQFRDAFPDSSDNQIILRYMDALRIVARLDELAPATPSNGGAAGDTMAGAPGAGGEP